MKSFIRFWKSIQYEEIECLPSQQHLENPVLWKELSVSPVVSQSEDFLFSLQLLEDTARYAGLLLAPAEGFGLRPRAKKRPYYAVLDNFRPFLVSCSNLGNF